MKEVLYYLYERRLLRQMRRGPIPTHIGIMLDGNRRYGQRHGLTDLHAICSLGSRKLDEVLDIHKLYRATICLPLSLPFFSDLLASFPKKTMAKNRAHPE
jgi:undecaprenyl pyrophosphate synthase